MKLSISICFLLLLINISKELSISKDMQFNNYGDLKADFTWLEIDGQSVNLSVGFGLEKNTIIVEPYVIKLVYTPLQKYHFIKMSEIVIFNNFEILFDMNIITKNIFGLPDNQRFVKVQSVLDKLKNRYGQNAENCRFIFSNNIENMLNINISTTSVNTFSQVNDMNPYLSLVMNIFCFSSMDNAIIFNSSLMRMFNEFVESTASKHLFYFNKASMNNLKVIFRSMKMNMQTNTASLVGEEDSEYISGYNQSNINNNISNLNIQYAYLILSNEGALFSDAPSNTMQNVLHSFNYDTIRDCIVEHTPKNRVLPNQMLQSENNKCCIKMRIDVKDVYDNILNICSYKSSFYQCNLEAKYIQETLSNKCVKRLVFNIGKAFDENYNINDYLMSKRNKILYKLYKFCRF